MQDIYTINITMDCCKAETHQERELLHPSTEAQHNYLLMNNSEETKKLCCWTLVQHVCEI